MRYKHIIFDIDGTLIHTKDAVLLSMQDTLKTVTGICYDPGELTFSLGIPGRDALRELNITDIESTMELWEKNMECYRHTIRIFPGITNVLTALQQSGCSLGVVTSETKDELAQDFGRLGLAPYFTTIVCASDTVCHKPSPEPLLKYMDLTGADRSDILYIGDSIYDSQCARSAHVDFALAVWGCMDQTIDADHYFDTPLDLLPVQNAV